MTDILMILVFTTFLLSVNNLLRGINLYLDNGDASGILTPIVVIATPMAIGIIIYLVA